MYEFTNSVSLLGSSRDTALHFGDEELRYESREILQFNKTAQICIRKLK